MSAAGVFHDEGWAGLAARLLGAEARRRVRVLVVDDHVPFADLLTLGLELGGRFEVVGHARDGREAVEEAAWLRPDLVLMDVEMPVLDGIEATRRVLAAAPGAKVVVVSSSVSADDRRRAREAGAIGFLGKQSSLDALVEALERLVFQVVPLTAARAESSAERPSTP